MIPLLTLWHDITLSTMAWYHALVYLHYSYGKIGLLTLWHMVPLSTLWHDTAANTIHCMLMLWHDTTINTMS